MIQPPIPYYLGQYAVFSDTLDTDDTTEELVLNKPDGTVQEVTHGELVRTVNVDGTITYSYTIALDQHGQWTGQFQATGQDANVAPIQAYVAL